MINRKFMSYVSTPCLGGDIEVVKQTDFTSQRQKKMIESDISPCDTTSLIDFLAHLNLLLSS
ncbi:MAG TPA: hypothetical protein VE130_09860 [Nitrososphaeraceae archaeon]|nr:hypothetical protein [Nitrososphaeraceae archaeon]